MLTSSFWPSRSELFQVLRLAAPIVMTQLGQVAMLTTDVLMIGRLGETALAAGGLGANSMFVMFIIAMGIVMATASLASQAFGARNPRRVRRVVRQGLWITILLTVPSAIVLQYFAPVLHSLGQPAAVVSGAQIYLNSLAWCLPTAIGFMVLRNFVSALSRPALGLWVMLGGVPINAVLDYAFIFGELGAPRLELFGAGLTTAIVNFLMFAVMLFLCTTRRPFRRYSILVRFWKPDWSVFGRIFAVGTPIAGIYLVEMGVFTLAFLMMGWISTTAMAAHEIAIQIASITFMLSFGISQAATVLVGQAAGRGDAVAARRAGWLATALGVLFMIITGITIAIWGEFFASQYLDLTRSDSGPVLALAASLLLVAAAFQIVDGAQSILAGSLRGLNDTSIPMALAAFGYWGVGFGIGYWLGIEAGWGAVGIWIGLAVGLLVVSILMGLRFYQLTRGDQLPKSVAGSGSGSLQGG